MRVEVQPPVGLDNGVLDRNISGPDQRQHLSDSTHRVSHTKLKCCDTELHRLLHNWDKDTGQRKLNILFI